MVPDLLNVMWRCFYIQTFQDAKWVHVGVDPWGNKPSRRPRRVLLIINSVVLHAASVHWRQGAREGVFPQHPCIRQLFPIPVWRWRFGRTSGYLVSVPRICRSVSFDSDPHVRTVGRIDVFVFLFYTLLDHSHEIDNLGRRGQIVTELSAEPGVQPGVQLQISLAKSVLEGGPLFQHVLHTIHVRQVPWRFLWSVVRRTVGSLRHRSAASFYGRRYPFYRSRWNPFSHRRDPFYARHLLYGQFYPFRSVYSHVAGGNVSLRRPVSLCVSLRGCRGTDGGRRRVRRASVGIGRAFLKEMGGDVHHARHQSDGLPSHRRPHPLRGSLWRVVSAMARCGRVRGMLWTWQQMRWVWIHGWVIWEPWSVRDVGVGRHAVPRVLRHVQVRRHHGVVVWRVGHGHPRGNHHHAPLRLFVDRSHGDGPRTGQVSRFDERLGAGLHAVHPQLLTGRWPRLTPRFGRHRPAAGWTRLAAGDHRSVHHRTVVTVPVVERQWVVRYKWLRAHLQETKEGRKEMFYLTTHSTHIIFYGYMASDCKKRTHASYIY